MDGPRFDAMTRRLAGRWSRRAALGRGSVGLAALLGGVGGVGGFGSRGGVTARQADTETETSRFVIVRTYQPSGSLDDLQQVLTDGYAPLLAQQQGFVEYFVFSSGSLVVSVTVFEDQQSEQAATNQVADWVSQNLASLLPSPGETLAGMTIAQAASSAAYCPAPPSNPTAVPVAPTPPPIVPPTAPPAQPTPTAAPAQPSPTALPICSDPAEPGRGCPCQTGTENPCGADTLLCCPNAANQPPGGPGTCTPDRLGCDPTGNTPTPAPTQLPVCTDPSRPGVGCACQTGTQNPCGGTTLLCCGTGSGLMGGPGICTPATVGCDPTGETPTPVPTQLPICSDPSRPGVGCACSTGTENPCGDTTLLCCADDPNGSPGEPGTCTPSSVGCQPLGPTPTPTPTPPCTGRGCRCNGGVQGACDDGLTCCPDNPGLPGGPGRCIREGNCNPSQDCTSEGCTCHTGVAGACVDGLVCCADDSSQPGGPGRCEAEQICFANQCQATTNPCPSSCAAGANCTGCCSGYCGGDGTCSTPPCGDQGCECTAGTANPCNDGLVCCSNTPGIADGPGTCVAASACDAGDDSTSVASDDSTGDTGADSGGDAGDAADDGTGDADDSGGAGDSADDTSDATDATGDRSGATDEAGDETDTPDETDTTDTTDTVDETSGTADDVDDAGGASDAAEDSAGGSEDTGAANDAADDRVGETGEVDPTPVE